MPRTERWRPSRIPAGVSRWASSGIRKQATTRASSRNWYAKRRSTAQRATAEPRDTPNSQGQLIHGGVSDTWPWDTVTWGTQPWANGPDGSDRDQPRD